MRIYNGVPGMLLSAVFGAAVTFGLSALFGAVLYLFFDDLSFAGLFSTAACILGCFAGAFSGGKLRRRRGLVDGVICGLLIYVIFSAGSILTAGCLTGIRKLLLLVVSGASGGVAGVNSKRPKRLM